METTFLQCMSWRQNWRMLNQRQVPYLRLCYPLSKPCCASIHEHAFIFFSEHQTHYEQWGEMWGTFQVQGHEEMKLSLRGIRDHSYGKIRNIYFTWIVNSVSLLFNIVYWWADGRALRNESCLYEDICSNKTIWNIWICILIFS